MQIECLLLIAQVLVERGYDLNKGSHDIGEESDTSQHDKDAKHHFIVRLGRQVTIAHRGQGRDWKVTRRDHTVGAASVLQLVIINEVVPFVVFEETWPKVEETADEIGDNDCKQDKSEHTVDVFHDEWKDNFLASSLVGEQGLHKLVDPVHLQQSKDALNSNKSDKFKDDRVITCLNVDCARVWFVPLDQVEWNCRDEVKDEASLDIGDCDLSMGNLGCFFILRQPQELEDDVECEKDSHHVFKPENPVVADVKDDGSEVHWGEARVDDDDEHESVPKV